MESEHQVVRVDSFRRNLDIFRDICEPRHDPYSLNALTLLKPIFPYRLIWAPLKDYFFVSGRTDKCREMSSM